MIASTPKLVGWTAVVSHTLGGRDIALMVSPQGIRYRSMKSAMDAVDSEVGTIAMAGAASIVGESRTAAIPGEGLQPSRFRLPIDSDLSLDRPLNFPDDLSTAPGVYVPKKKKRVETSRFRGVSWNKTNQKWFASLSIAGKTTYIGIYDDETEAARAYDATVRAQSLDKPLNFPDDLSTAPGVYVPKKKRVASRIVEISWGELG